MAVQWCLAPCSIWLTHEYDVSLELRESESPWAAAVWCSKLPLHVIMLLLFVTWLYQVTELETLAKLLQISVLNTPQMCCLTYYGLFDWFNSILSRYYKPVHPRPLVYIILLLEKFLFFIALSFGGGFHGAWMTTQHLAEWIVWSAAGTLSTEIPSGCFQLW